MEINIEFNINELTKKPIKEIKRFNERFVSLINLISKILLFKNKKENLKKFEEAKNEIIMYSGVITDVEEIKDIINDTVYKYLNEYYNTGTLDLFEEYKENPLIIFSQIYDISPKKARELVKKYNIKSISELRENTDKLTKEQQLGLKYYEDLLERIPLKEIDKFKVKLNEIFDKESKQNSNMEFVGSYRRKYPSSSSIDILFKNKNDNNSDYKKFIDVLIKEGIITDIIERSEEKTVAICKLKDTEIHRKTYFIFSPQNEYPFAKLYYTGSETFNIFLTNKALEKGYILTKKGIKNEKEKSKKVKIKNERDIFELLGYKFIEPEKRKIGKASKKENIDNILKKFLKKGVGFLSTLDEEILSKMIERANYLYYNKKSIINDETYDILKEYIEDKYPDNKAIKLVGAPIIAKSEKVELPYYLGSMDKMKPDTKILDKWIKKYKGPYIISTKLDGVSALYYNEDGENKLYTRGNGKIGQDISHLIPYLSLPTKEEISIRGEIIMKKKVFEKKYSEKTSNPRNFVSGIINSKTVDKERVMDIDFVAYEVIYPIVKPEQQFELLESYSGLDVAFNKKETDITNEKLSKYLEKMRSDYTYEIDGIIVSNNKIYDRVVDKNPEHSIAFKMVLSDQIAEAKVLDVLWEASSYGYLKPRIQIDKTFLNGVNIEFITGNNARFIKDNKIGPGAIVKFIRSGDVIPKIMEVIKPSETGGKLPDVEYEWTDSNVDIILVNKKDDISVLIKIIEKFFKVIDTPGMGPGTIKKLVNSGFDSINSIINITYDDLMKIEGIKTKSAKNIIKSINESINKATIPVLMVASNIFGRGFGIKKINIIMKEYPNIILSPEEDETKIDNISSLSGFSSKSAKEFVKKIKLFIDFISDNSLGEKLVKKVESILKSDDSSEIIDKTHVLYNKKILLTGFRDKSLQEEIEKVGGIIESNFKKDLNYLITKNSETKGSKVDKALKKEIPIITVSDFKEKFLA
jgi:NAD-dependent DNA ligase